MYCLVIFYWIVLKGVFLAAKFCFSAPWATALGLKYRDVALNLLNLTNYTYIIFYTSQNVQSKVKVIIVFLVYYLGVNTMRVLQSHISYDLTTICCKTRCCSIVPTTQSRANGIFYFYFGISREYWIWIVRCLRILRKQILSDLLFSPRCKICLIKIKIRLQWLDVKRFILSITKVDLWS